MKEIIDGGLSQDIADWTELAKNKCSDKELLKSIFERGGWTASLDFPASMCWTQLAEIYPDAKLIHTERASPEKWWESAKSTILNVHNSFPIRVFVKLIPFWTNHHEMCDEMWRVITGKPDISDTHEGWPYIYKKELLDGYSRNNAHVREVEPSDRVLIMDPKQGYTLLAPFLNKKNPDKPYPFTNTQIEFVRFVRSMWLVSGVVIILFVTLVAFLVKKLLEGGGDKKNKTQ